MGYVIAYILAILEGLLIVIRYHFGIGASSTTEMILGPFATLFGAVMIAVGVHGIASIVMKKIKHLKD